MNKRFLSELIAELMIVYRYNYNEQQKPEVIESVHKIAEKMLSEYDEYDIKLWMEINNKFGN